MPRRAEAVHPMFMCASRRIHGAQQVMFRERPKNEVLYRNNDAVPEIPVIDYPLQKRKTP